MYAHSFRRIFQIALLSALTIALFAVPGRAIAQQTAQARHSQNADAANNPSASETPKSEEEQEQGFLNAPVVHKAAGLLHISEPAARILFLAINFLIILLAIAIPLTRTMPKVFRKRSQTLRHSLDLARKATEEARQRLSAVETRLAGLDKEIAAFRAQVEQESLEDEKRIKASLKEESERIMAATEQEIGAVAIQARRSLRAFAADLAIEHATRQIQLTPETDRALIREFIGQVAATSGAGEAGNGSAAASAKGGKK